MVDDAVQALEAQTAYFVGKGQVHQFVQANQINGYVVRFTDDYLHDFSPSLDGSFESILFRKVNSVRFIKLDKKETDNLDKWFGLVFQEFTDANHSGSQAVIGHLLHILLLKLEDALRSSDLPSRQVDAIDNGLYSSFLRQLEESYKVHHEVVFYANALNVTPRQLSDHCKQQTGKLPKYVVEERLILEAKRYLAFSHQSVKSIAFDLGYDDPSYFSKVFKRHTGYSPKDFRFLG